MAELITIIDVRTASEYRGGHKEGAINIELSTLMAGTMPDLPSDTPIKVYCRSGARSAIARRVLMAHGFVNVEDLGGYRG